MIKETREGAVFRARVKAGCPSFRIFRQAGSITIECRSPPRENRANSEIVRELSRIFGRAEILRGASGREKLILLRGLTGERLDSYLDRQSHRDAE
jgi:uncharacterized protein (TIGR00251 family)